MNNPILFSREFFRTFHTTGSVIPSGRQLAHALASPLGDLTSPRRILEAGPGTGPVTGLLIESLRPGDELLLCEINSVFADHLQSRLSDDPKWRERSSQVRLHRGDIREVLEPGGFHAVVSGLPLNNFPSSLVAEIVQGFLGSLRPGGVHTFFEYAWLRGLRTQWGPKRDRERLREIGAVIHQAFAGQILSRRLILWNFPPAWAYSVSSQ